MCESRVVAFLRVPWHQRLYCPVWGIHPLHQGDLVDCHERVLCMWGFSAEIQCPFVDAVRVVSVFFHNWYCFFSLCPLFCLPWPPALICFPTTKAQLPYLLRYLDTGSGAQYSLSHAQRMLRCTKAMCCELGHLSVYALLLFGSLCVVVFLVVLLLFFLPCASDRRLAGCMRSGFLLFSWFGWPVFVSSSFSPFPFFLRVCFFFPGPSLCVCLFRLSCGLCSWGSLLPSSSAP